MNLTRTHRRAPGQARSSQRTGLPYVLVNMAMSADGKIAPVSRAGVAFGSRRDKEHLLALRATVDAVMAGARTVEAAAITLGAGPLRFRRERLRRGLAAHNLRVVVSGSGSLNPSAHLFSHGSSPVIVLTTARAPEHRLRALRAVADAVHICGKKQVSFRAALRWLYTRWGVRRLLCEGGGELNAALFREGLVDELHLTVCPLLLGGRDAPTVADGPEGRTLAAATGLALTRARRFGNELFLVLERRPCRPGAGVGQCRPATQRR